MVFSIIKWISAVKEVDYVPSTAMMITSEVLETIGGFDEDFFVYSEDFDFCQRVKNRAIKFCTFQMQKPGIRSVRKS